MTQFQKGWNAFAGLVGIAVFIGLAVTFNSCGKSATSDAPSRATAQPTATAAPLSAAAQSACGEIAALELVQAEITDGTVTIFNLAARIDPIDDALVSDVGSLAISKDSADGGAFDAIQPVGAALHALRNAADDPLASLPPANNLLSVEGRAISFCGLPQPDQTATRTPA